MLCVPSMRGSAKSGAGSPWRMGTSASEWRADQTALPASATAARASDAEPGQKRRPAAADDAGAGDAPPCAPRATRMRARERQASATAAATSRRDERIDHRSRGPAPGDGLDEPRKRAHAAK